jgi:hypothetical protein
MRRNQEDDVVTQVELVLCAGACGRPAECCVWDRHICYPCAADWYVNAPQTADDATYEAFTARWLEARHRRAA